MNKRGVSPLVATLVLILVAVAMAMAVMNFTQAQIPSKCSMLVGVKVNQIENKDQICLDRTSKQIKIQLQNGPSVPIKKLNFKIFLEDLEVITREPIQSRMQPDEAKTFLIDFDPETNPNIKEIRITPSIADYENTVPCPEQNIIIKEITDC